jgi:hypothetical protein
MTTAVLKKVDSALDQLLNSIELGTIGLTDCERPFVWTPTRVRDLFDSMHQGFPGRLSAVLEERHLGVGRTGGASPTFAEEQFERAFSVIVRDGFLYAGADDVQYAVAGSASAPQLRSVGAISG